MKVILADGKLIFLEVVLNTWSPPSKRLVAFLQNSSIGGVLLPWSSIYGGVSPHM